MKTNIYYFSATGNSLAVARDIAKGLEEAYVVPIHKVMKYDLDMSADAIGVVFPVYMWGLPLIVVEFLKKFKGITGKYIFAVATYGGFPAYTLQQAADQLKRQGSRLNLGAAVHMPGNYTPMYSAKSLKSQEALFRKEKEKIAKIIGFVKAKKDGGIQKNAVFINDFFSGILYNNGIKTVSKADSQYYADTKCDGCGICAKVCPVSNIRMENNKPVWLHNCQHCLACLQWCPAEAVQCGKSTVKRKRYHHPDVKLSDFIN